MTESSGSDLAGTRLLVTGGSRGIGRAIALAAAARGADVAITYREQTEQADSAVQEIERLGRSAVAIRADLSDHQQAAEAVASTDSELGSLTGVVINAGMMVSAPILEMPIEALDQQFAVNARGAYVVARAAAKSMISRGEHGKLIFVTSRAARRPLANLSGYCMSKAAEEMLMKVLAVELASHGITANAVSPGTTETDLNRDLLRDPVSRQRLLEPILLGRPVQPAEVASAVCFLLSPDASFITGCTLTVDGGASL